jgi:peptide/nickel transport system substrate-binding protein
MNRKILAILLMLSITTMLLIPIASVGSTGIPNQDTITYATIGGPDGQGGADPSWAYDTSSSMMIQNVLEPLFMYDNLSTGDFIPMLSDYWPGFNENPGHWITTSPPDLLAPDGTNQTWYFHIRQGVKWQNSAYGNLTGYDVEYSIERGMLQDAPTGVQWLLYQPLLGTTTYADSVDPKFDTNGDGLINSTEYVKLDSAIRDSVQTNGTWVWFNLPAGFAPFMQILTQSWAMVQCKQWDIDNLCWNGQHGNYTEFTRTYQPENSPLMDTSVVGSSWPMMGTGPYMLKVFNTDPHTGFQSFEKFDNYWQGWPASFAKYATIKIVEEWANRKAQFFSTDPSLQIDFCDVPTPNAPELHLGGLKDGPTYPGFRLTKYTPQVAGYAFFNYNVTQPSDFTPLLGATAKPDLFSDRDLRLAFIECFNTTQFLADYFLGEATTPTGYMCVGTAYYNASSVFLRNINLTLATQHFQAAWGGQVWNQGITVKLLYNTGNLARQTICSMIADVIMHRIAWPGGVTVTITATPVPWSEILVGLSNGKLSTFIIGWMADYPDPSDWAGPFMSPTGTYGGIGQHIDYGLNATSLAAEWLTAADYGPPPYTNALDEAVTAINSTYVEHIISRALGAPAATREKLYNELMDIFYAEGGQMPAYQALARHYERDTINGWVGRYSNNPVAVGDYFYQIWKATSQTIYGVDVSAEGSITNTTTVYPLILNNLTGNMVDYKTLAAVYVNYTLHVTYLDASGPTIWVTVELLRTEVWTKEYYFPIFVTRSLGPGESTTVNVQWHESKTMTDCLWELSCHTDPIGTAGGVVYDVNTTNNKFNSPYKVKSVPYNRTYTFADLGGSVPPAFFSFDDLVNGKDLALFLQCFKGTAMPAAMYMGDLGSGVPPTFFSFDGLCNGKDLSLFLQCFKGQGPP